MPRSLRLVPSLHSKRSVPAPRSQVVQLLAAGTLTFMVCLVPGAPARAWTEEAMRPIVTGERITWPAQRERVLVQLTSPSGRQIEGAFEPGEAPSLSLADLAEDGRLAEGAYKFSLHLLGEEDQETVRRRMSEVRRLDAGSDEARSPRERARTSFGVVRLPQVPSPSGSGDTSRGGDLHVVSAPFINDVAATPSLWLEDTTAEGSGTETDWILSVDLTSQGDGDSDLIFYSFDQSSGSNTNFRYPFVLENGAPTNTLYVSDLGNVGLGTNTPQGPLQITHSIPRIRFEDNAGTLQTWTLFGDSQAFEVHDSLTFTSPFRVRPGAPSGALFIASSGNVGLGTSSPQGNLHIHGLAGQDVFSGIGPDLLVGPAFNFGYSGSSFGVGSGFFNARPAAGAVAPNPALYFMTNNVDRLMIDRDGDIAVDMDNSFGNTFDPQHPIHAQLSGARLTAAGVWTNASSRALKENVEALSLDAALAALAALEPVTYNYRVEPGDPQVGFIAEDVPELVATPDRTTLAHGDIVSVLTRVVQAQQRELEQQREALRAQRRLLDRQAERIDRLTHGMAVVTPKTESPDLR